MLSLQATPPSDLIMWQVDAYDACKHVMRMRNLEWPMCACARVRFKSRTCRLPATSSEERTYYVSRFWPIRSDYRLTSRTRLPRDIVS